MARFLTHARFCAMLLTASLSTAALPAPALEAPRHAAPNPLAESEKALLQGRDDEAIAGLHAVLEAAPGNAPAHLLLCRAYYAEELPEPAVSECEAAVAALGSDSQAQDWMGRAYGLKADRSGPIAGYKLAAKVKAAFELAVQLNPRSDAAVHDLGQYYVNAPSLVGGGTERALDLANRVQATSPQESHWIRAVAAEKDRDFGAAEREFRAEVGVAGRPDAWSDLGFFYYRQSKDDLALDALHHALDADRTHDAALVDVASILIKMKREPQTAEQALMAYLSSSARTDEAPAFKAYVELGKLKQSLGDKAGAESAYQSALGLAKDFAPAKKAIQHV